MKPRIANRDARDHVQRKQEFRGNNIFGEWMKGSDEVCRYVVCSYGPHWPLFIYDPVTERWYENTSKYGRTTSKHHGQTHPHPLEPTTGMVVEDMIKIVDGGITRIISSDRDFIVEFAA